MQEDNEIIVREYIDKDYNDIIRAGYPFDPYLKRDLYNSFKNLNNRKGIESIIFRNIFLNKEEIILVAYSKKNEETVGVITLRKITDDLWGIWHVFVSPTSRGKGIASLLYQECFKLLRDEKVKKAIGLVFQDNVASIKSVQRNWQGFLSTRIFECKKKTQLPENKLSNKISIRKHRGDRKKELFEIFRNCVGKQWCSVLEINEDNFLDRLLGPAYVEPMSKNILCRLIMKTNTFIAESKGKIEGYALSRVRRFGPFVNPISHLFIPMSENFSEVCKRLLTKESNPLTYGIKGEINFVCMENREVEEHLQKLGLKVKHAVVPYKYL